MITSAGLKTGSCEVKDERQLPNPSSVKFITFEPSYMSQLLEISGIAWLSSACQKKDSDVCCFSFYNA